MQKCVKEKFGFSQSVRQTDRETRTGIEKFALSESHGGDTAEAK